MKIVCPTLQIEQSATETLIAEVVAKLEGRKEPFAILESDELTYMQVLWTARGYDLEYQERHVMHHFRLVEPVTADKAIWALQAYLAGDGAWKSRFQFVGKDIAGFPYKIAYAIGQFVGGFKRGFHEERNSNKTIH